MINLKKVKDKTKQVRKTDKRKQLANLRGIRCDFPGMYMDKMCPLECGENDKIENKLRLKLCQAQVQLNLSF